MARGKFIVLEGIDGSGKSTQATLLAEALKARGQAVRLTREPTKDTEAGRRLRELAVKGRNGVTLEEETRLFQEDRSQHVRTVIAPALDRDETVVSDRYWYSTVAYQGALGANRKAIQKESREKFPAPDLVIYLRVTPQEALRRIHAGRSAGPAVAYEKEEFLEKVLEGYESQVEPSWLVLDGMRPAEEIATKLLERTLKLFTEARG